MTASASQPILGSSPAAPFRFLGQPTVMHSTGETTGGAFGLLEHWDMPPGFASPYHTHHREDEAFYILEGQVATVSDGKWSLAGAGSYVFAPRLIPHGFKIAGTLPARMLLLCSPAGFEHFVLEQAVDMSAPLAPPDMDRLMELAAKYQIDIHGPLPEQS